MEIRIRESGQIVNEKQFREIHEKTSFPKVLSEQLLDSFGADLVFEGPVPNDMEWWQYPIRDGVKKIQNKWYTKYIAGPIFETTELRDLYVSNLQTEKDKAIKDSLISEIRKEYDDAISSIESLYYVKERETWPQQVSEARAFLVDEESSTPLLDAMLTERPLETKQQLVNKIITNYSLYSQAVGVALGRMQVRIKEEVK